jgi:serine/threonine-protein kinase
MELFARSACVFDIGEHEGERFLTMEYIEGQTLSARINAGANNVGRPLAAPLLLQVIQQVCMGLSSAHSVGVIHRDLKPDNIMLGNDGRVAITDFGIARAWEPRGSSVEATNEFVGTPEYMSPEQAEGGALDLRTDIYSLGVVLFESLTGTLPFLGTTPLVTAAARLLKPPPDPRSRRPELSEPVALVVLRCLARLPKDRYASAEEVAEALTDALQGAGRSGSGAFAAVGPGRTPSVDLPLSPAAARVTDDHSLLHSSLTRTLDIQASGKSIAVVPFRNQGPPEDEYLADGLTDDLIDGLSMVPGLRVLSRGAVQAHAEKADPMVLGRALGLDVLVEGAVRRLGQQLRISARLVTVQDGVQAWAQRFDCPAADALKVSDEVAQAVATALTLKEAAPPRAVLQDAQAVDLYLRARAASLTGDPDALRESLPLYEQALALRPNDPTVLTAYAQVLARLWFFGGEGTGDLARAVAERAVAAAPERGESHVAMATIHFNVADPAGAVRDLKRALKLAPRLAAAHDLLGRILIESGPHELGLRYIGQAMELDASITRTQMDRARVQALLGDFDGAYRILKSTERDGVLPAGTVVMYSRLVVWERNRAVAEEILNRQELNNPQLSWVRRILETFLYNQHTEPRQLLHAGMGSTFSSLRGRSFYFQMETEIYCLFEEGDNAIRSLARAVDGGLYDRLWLDNCPLLSSLRVDLRFHALRKIVSERCAQVQEALR